MAWLPLQFIPGDEMAVRIHFDKPVGFADSGPRLIPPLYKCRFRKYPKKAYYFLYENIEIFTKDTKDFRDKYGFSQAVKMNAGIYLNFPREERVIVKKNEEVAGYRFLFLDEKGEDGNLIEILVEASDEKEAWREAEEKKKQKKKEMTHPLIKIFRNSIPVDEESLKKWLEGTIEEKVRAVGGEVILRDLIEKREEIIDRLREKIKDEKSVLIKKGFSPEGIDVIIPYIDIPSDLKRALSRPATAQISLDVADVEGQARATSLATEAVGIIVGAMAQSRGKGIEEIKKEIDAKPDMEKDTLNRMIDIVKTRMAIDGQAYLDIRTEAGEPGKTLLDFLAAWKRMPMGATRGEETKKEEKMVDETKEGLKKPLSPEKEKTKKEQVRTGKREKIKDVGYTILGIMFFLSFASLVVSLVVSIIMSIFFK